MPIELSQIIQDYARPRIDWRQGGSFSSKMFIDGLYNKFDIIYYRIIMLMIYLI